MDKIVEFYILKGDKRLAPYKKHKGDAGFDLRSADDYTILPGETMALPTGIAVRIPEGYVGLIKPRSSWGLKGFNTTAGVIDSTYRGEIKIVLQNLSNKAYYIGKYERIAQLIVTPVILRGKVFLGEPPMDTERKDNGFGSTGKE